MLDCRCLMDPPSICVVEGKRWPKAGWTTEQGFCAVRHDLVSLNFRIITQYHRRRKMHLMRFEIAYLPSCMPILLYEFDNFARPRITTTIS